MNEGRTRLIKNAVVRLLVVLVGVLFSGCMVDDVSDLKDMTAESVFESNKVYYAAGARDVYLSIGLPRDAAIEAADTFTLRAFGEGEE